MQTKWTDCCVFIPEAEVAGGTDAQIQGMGTQATAQAFSISNYVDDGATDQCMKDWPQGTVFVNRVDSLDLAMVNPGGLSAIWDVKKPVRYMSMDFQGEMWTRNIGMGVAGVEMLLTAT